MKIGNSQDQLKTVDVCMLPGKGYPLTCAFQSGSILQNHCSVISGILELDTCLRDVFAQHFLRVLWIAPVPHKIRFAIIQSLQFQEQRFEVSRRVAKCLHDPGLVAWIMELECKPCIRIIGPWSQRIEIFGK